MSKPFSQACENNKRPILEIISRVFADGDRVLEIGAGTGQHAVFFAEQMPRVTWLPSDTPESMATLRSGLAGEERDNLLEPVTLDVCRDKWPEESVDGVFSANCLHIMPEEAMDDFFAGVGKVLKPGGHLCVYGPFKYNGEYTTESNARFDQWLKERDPRSGVREFEKVNGLAEEQGLERVADHDMPANNQLIVWRRAPMTTVPA